MRAILLLFSLFFTGAWAFAQGTGDLSFIAWNADGDDGFAMVTWVELAPNTTILFRDEEWDGSAFGTGEGQAEWNTGDVAIPAGTVILFQNTSTPTPTVSFGTLSNTDIALSATSEGIFCFIGTDTQTPSTFICAIGNAGESVAFGTLAGTGLSVGTTAIVLPSGADVAEYVGPRTGLDVGGYQLALNDNANYLTQDGSGDQHNDGTAPDEPFSTTPFEISDMDLTPPSAVGVTINSSTQLTIQYSEAITPASAEALANYLLAPAVSIVSVVYDVDNNRAVLTHAGFTTAVAYTLTVSGLEDLAGNVQLTPSVFTDLLVNAARPNLRITEIMYNAPTGANELEFVEIWNFGAEAVELGGFVFRDEANFVYTFPAGELAANTGLLLASDADGAAAFYTGATFIDLPGSGNLLGNGGEALQLLNSIGDVIDAVEYDDAAPWPLAADGSGPSLELFSPELDQNLGTSWIASLNVVGNLGGIDVLASPGTYAAITLASASFQENHSIFLESQDTVRIPVSILGNLGQGSLTIAVESTNAIAGTDFELLTTTVDLATLPMGDATIEVSIAVVDNSVADNARYIALQLSGSNILGGSIGRHVVYLNDDDAEVPVATDALDLRFTTSYLVEGGGSAEILAHDATTDRLFVVNSINTKLHILDFSNPAAITEISQLDMTVYGSAITSVAVRNGLVAVSVDAGDFATGRVIFLDTDGAFINEVTVGSLPDHLSFTPDGNFVLTANEGQPSDDYTTDPEGSVSIVDLSAGVMSATVSTAGFTAFNGDLADLLAAGVRIFGPGATVAQDMEPEYITYSFDSGTAYVTCQENNALAIVDIASRTITDILPLGYKDYRELDNAFDFSDRTDSIVFANWPVLGMYQPDALDYFEVEGEGYLITANEGDARDYGAFSEESRISGLNLDPTAFPDADFLQQNTVLGRLNATTATGDTDGDGDIDEIYTYGSRSFSVWNATTGALVWDSGNELERITAADTTYGSLFNASNSNNNYKNRSDDKGPEPESVTTATIGGKVYGFIGLERIGGIMVYDLSDPTAPAFTTYVNNRTLGDDEGGDLGPEGLLYLPPTESPTDTGLIVVANEVSATVSVYTITNDELVSISDRPIVARTIKVFPNPTNLGVSYFERPVSYRLYDVRGTLVKSAENAAYAELSGLPAGTYILKSTQGEVARIVVSQ
ncbi:choice-of-anchor I family protein [Neolewinella lacunae]|uniref:Choice-of-anchor I family protein n=1 Tax=Neolewinella lacunae TaxID=1517758 RepID=A0A923PH65_9BACT|nr:choice-of-anchor I family protein [Neolewinella lacunae]MBC6993992.1 choice-of-anchor I family protein [Neolewinella lacunae]MDN3634662.1 choice-of-anchor I family protein [Neolewinella lacunae]